MWVNDHNAAWLSRSSVSLALRRSEACSLSKKFNWMVLWHWTKQVITVSLTSCIIDTVCAFDSDNNSKLTLPCCLSSLRDRPNLFYFDILKCATSVNVMASALNGFQCPTTQVERLLGRISLTVLWLESNLPSSLSLGVRGNMPH